MQPTVAMSKPIKHDGDNSLFFPFLGQEDTRKFFMHR